MSLPSAPNLEARLEGSFGVPDVLVLLVLEPEETVLSPLLPFLFAAFWARGLGRVWPLSFDLSWLAGVLECTECPYKVWDDLDKCVVRYKCFMC